jgi:hypothetical protein
MQMFLLVVWDEGGTKVRFRGPFATAEEAQGWLKQRAGKGNAGTLPIEVEAFTDFPKLPDGDEEPKPAIEALK